MQDNPTSLRVPDPGVRALFARDARWQAWLDVEVALARAEAELGVIPTAAAAEIAAEARLDRLDRARIEDGLRRTGHLLVPLVWELSRVCAGDAGGYIHWGATTQNIVQTGDLLQLRRAHRIFLAQIATILESMADLAERSRDMALPGRTHGQHAVPVTFGFKVAAWIDETRRHAARLRGAEARVFVAMLGGAAGTFASFGERGPEIQARMAAHLDMAAMETPSRAIGDHLAEYVGLLGLLGATCGKIAREIYTLMKQEFGEVAEGASDGTIGSSTMPQKQNPILSQDVVAMAATLRALTPLALEAMQTEHEADRATSLMMRRAVEEACGLTGDILSRMQMLIAGLRIDPARMRRNLDLTGGLIMAEAVMLALGRQIGRQAAHDAVHHAAQATARGEGRFETLLAANETVRGRLAEAEIAGLLDPAAYTGECARIASTQASRAREAAAALRAAAATTTEESEK